MGIRGVIFDLGHTLMHLDRAWPEVFRQGAADLAVFVDGQGLDLDGGAFAQALLDHRKEGFALAQETMREVTAESTMLQTYAYLGLPEPGPALVRSSIDAFFAYEESRWLADPAAIPVLRELAGRGMDLGMFSNATDDYLIQRLVDRLGFRPWLDPSLSSAGTGIRKPDPAAFAPLLSAWDLPPRTVVMVGDTLEADILGAQRAGLRHVWIRAREDARQEGLTPGEASQRQSVVPEVTISQLRELPDCLRKL